jgi:hypothetical protein
MKKLIVFCSMIVALGFVATGCGGGDSKPETDTPAATQSDDADEGAGAAEEAQ